MPRAKQPAQSNQTPPSNPTVGNESTGNGNNTHSRSYADATSGKTPNQVNNPIWALFLPLSPNLNNDFLARSHVEHKWSCSQQNELEVFMKSNMIDVCLISESHTTSRSRINVPGYSVYLTPHPDGGAHAGAAIIIKNSVKHCLLDPFAAPYLQATSIRVEDRSGFLNLSAIYCPPRHTIKEEMFSDFFKTLGNRFIAGGDWNAKHSHWGSRITVTRGKELKKSIDANHLRSMSTGEPTYWPTDSNKTPDLLDFFITKNICLQNTLIKSSLDGSSDHTPVILILSPIAIPHDSGTDYLHNSKTDWDCFREYLESNIDLKLSLKTNEEVDNASLYITNLIQVAAWTSTLS
ncbi:RNA-directed DNA polymerase from mobile element jockey [Eumeta japonica]|uniref:RNA-directed DNA polymerase from mobile element jockey n=2 Tax=Eumeta variegata TaxID=151549 RepID=A0A4C1YCS7_EUMVA|nr:RNA-directed DNA polymerase from mobile element jockey [Eumeta japonica]